MTDYETIMVFLGILALLVSFGTLLIALLAYIDRKNMRKEKMPNLSANRLGGVL